MAVNVSHFFKFGEGIFYILDLLCGILNLLIHNSGQFESDSEIIISGNFGT